MEISTYIDRQHVVVEDHHLISIQKNIDVWETFQNHEQIIQKKLIQTTSILQLEGLESFSLNITIPSTYFAGVEENYAIEFALNNTIEHFKDLQESTEEIEPIKLDLNFHRINSIYAMSHVIKVIFDLLKQKLSHTDIESIEILTSLIVFEMENLSKYRNIETEIFQEMFFLESPHVKWFSKINLKGEFNDYSLNHTTKYYH